MANPTTSVRVNFDTLRSLAFGSISGAYAAVGTAFNFPARLIKIANNTNADIIVSFDGINDHDFVASDGFVLYDYCTNQSAVGGYLEQAKGTVVYVKEASAGPSSGSVYVTAIGGSLGI